MTGTWWWSWRHATRREWTRGYRSDDPNTGLVLFHCFSYLSPVCPIEQALRQNPIFDSPISKQEWSIRTFCHALYPARKWGGDISILTTFLCGGPPHFGAQKKGVTKPKLGAFILPNWGRPRLPGTRERSEVSHPDLEAGMSPIQFWPAPSIREENCGGPPRENTLKSGFHTPIFRQECC